jgi:hypothetical protein
MLGVPPGGAGSRQSFKIFKLFTKLGPKKCPGASERLGLGRELAGFEISGNGLKASAD